MIANATETLNGVDLLDDLVRRAREFKAALAAALDDPDAPAPDMAEKFALLGMASFFGERWGRQEARRLAAERAEALALCGEANRRFLAADKARGAAVAQRWAAQDRPQPQRTHLLAAARAACAAAEPEFQRAGKQQREAHYALARVDSQLRALGATAAGHLAPAVAGRRESDRWRAAVEQAL